MLVADFDVKEIKTVVSNPIAVDLEALKASGVSVVSYGIHANDRIEFLDSYNENTVIGRSVGSGKEILVGVLRNGAPDWFSLAEIRRRNYEIEAVCPFREKMLALPNDFVRLEALAGKTIRAGEKIEYKVVKSFKQNETTGRMEPVCDENGDIILVPRTTYALYFVE